MLSERDQIFRDQLVALVTDLNKGESRDADLRRLVGAYARRIYTEAGTRGWVDLKTRAEKITYDSLLKVIQVQGEAAHKANDPKMVRAWEILGLSLIARTRNQADLVPGVGFLDRYIEECCSYAKKAGVTIITPKAKMH
jgi:hypothetical protein